MGKEDSDLRQLTFTFPITTATEINASIDNHLPMKYHMLPIEVPVLDYSKITSMVDKTNIALVELLIHTYVFYIDQN